MKKIIQNCLIGAGISSMLYLISGSIFANEEVRKNSLLILILGLLIGVCSSIYGATKLALLTKSVIQFSGSYLSFLFVAHLGGWFPFRLKIILSASVMFALIYLAIWAIFYYVEKKELEQLNKKLGRQ
ncbi:hypothetical protein IGI37_003804 [Enterococcus sp. AZ194]|uniref:DUF3021 domain-containing protein n=1 Tax=Enterococcus sp. AZ194 TaxID=2774629 RepID=UPI003F1F32A0